MNAINEDLLKSLSQDIRKINEINDNIGTYLEDNSENSTWFLSCKDENEILNLPKDKNRNHERYLSTLELIIDRIYLFLNCLLRFVETEYFDKDPLVKCKYVIRPKNLTLGTTVKLLWQQLTEIKPIIKNIYNVRPDSQMSQTNTKNLQTDISSFDACYTCTNVNHFVKKIVELFEKRFDIPGITQEKENIRKNIYNLTQHSCVDRFLKEIEKSVENIWEENDSLKLQIHNLSSELENKEFESTSLGREHKRLEITCAEYCENAQKDKQRYDKLYQRYNDLHFRNHQLEKCLRSESEKLTSAETLISKVQENYQILETRKNQLEKELEDARVTTKSLYAEKDMWKKRFLDENSENQNLKRDISNTHASVVEVKTHLNKVDMDYQALNDLLTKSTFEYKNTIQRYNTILHKLKEVIAAKLSIKKHQEDSVDRGDSINVGIKIEGNPLTDMTNQVKANEVLIEKLQEKNDHLLKVIGNLKKMEKHL
ncbi:centrosomal protein of 128 kDa-like [Agrilus planipennis]|uniref:Centrosomal protein of 128 kDa-like n=1 Tax=Agrilus planipennis TaxID=224129 RepID=A0A1W4XH82_AGRPL|nr:centrosomal protein of 128 kDa-like [Agrilus planipennis]